MCQHVGTWFHEVHGEESIVVLLVHGELSSSSALCSSLLHGSSWFLLLTSSTNWFTSSPSSSLSVSSLLLHWRTISLLLNKVHSNLKLPLLTLTTNRVIPLLGSPFFPQSLTLRLSSSEYTYPLHQILPSSDPSSSNRLAS
ncbi:unnamed protein product [Microthlaspi erraticum]|uniref:Uncharacterized protein n=1 Tax=Microthlaspi erraticum TaxID=1685480 RepID=A0A6D2KKD0_9BRAS|nr:unnamed protein product [Microthlaspi erraticum]